MSLSCTCAMRRACSPISSRSPASVQTWNASRQIPIPARGATKSASWNVWMNVRSAYSQLVGSIARVTPRSAA